MYRYNYPQTAEPYSWGCTKFGATGNPSSTLLAGFDGGAAKTSQDKGIMN